MKEEEIEAGKERFNKFIEEHRSAIHETIMRYMPAGPSEEYNELVKDYPNRQGKYGRPGLLVLTALAFGAKLEDVLLLAAIQQLSEDWLLLHDDIEDNSETRRGKPAIQRLVGDAQAINAGDALHVIMNGMLEEFAHRNGELGHRIFVYFNEMLKYTAEGQWYDNNFIHKTKDLSKATEALYMRIIDSKTCWYTIYGPMQLGAMFGGASDEQLRMLKEIGWETGVAFQIKDDLLDLTADEKHFGKQKYGDLYEGKPTLPTIHAYKNATAEERKRLDAIYKKQRIKKAELDSDLEFINGIREKYGSMESAKEKASDEEKENLYVVQKRMREGKTHEDIAFIAKMVEKYKGIEYAQAVANEHGAKAEELVKKYKSMFPQNEYTDMLVGAVRAMYKRSK